ncbi:hypothetical protein [Pseudoglutamicibacter cumminsii]|uniref:hypothetical protein n=1 Tax=Pseudoglutamicibacter cumminsii TaxID=156979 RepID=UPI00195BF5BC|nr:hypothetical protein [Pseudoglutamicibacter cumminsii]MBM7795838.1 hypothetical protein [Pseudoglutamicibacter cumminsii]
MATFDELHTEAHRRSLIRKAVKSVAFIRKKDADNKPIESIFGSDGSLLDLKSEGWLPIGLVTDDGYTFGRDTNVDDITSHGFANPTRKDVVSVERSVTTTIQEYGKRHVEELIQGADFSGVKQNAKTGEIVTDEQDLPTPGAYELLVIAMDGPVDQRWYLGKFFPSVQLSEASEEAWGKEGAIERELTFDVFSDEELGFPVRHFIGGPAASASKDILGYETAAGSEG